MNTNAQNWSWVSRRVGGAAAGAGPLSAGAGSGTGPFDCSKCCENQSLRFSEHIYFHFAEIPCDEATQRGRLRVCGSGRHLISIYIYTCILYKYMYIYVYTCTYAYVLLFGFAFGRPAGVLRTFCTFSIFWQIWAYFITITGRCDPQAERAAPHPLAATSASHTHTHMRMAIGTQVTRIRVFEPLRERLRICLRGQGGTEEGRGWVQVVRCFVLHGNPFLRQRRQPKAAAAAAGDVARAGGTRIPSKTRRTATSNQATNFATCHWMPTQPSSQAAHQPPTHTSDPSSPARPLTQINNNGRSIKKRIAANLFKQTAKFMNMLKFFGNVTPCTTSRYPAHGGIMDEEGSMQRIEV